MASVNSSPAAIKQVKFKIVCCGSQDAGVQTDLQAEVGFTGCHLICGDLMTTQKVDAEVQTDPDDLG